MFSDHWNDCLILWFAKNSQTCKVQSFFGLLRDLFLQWILCQLLWVKGVGFGLWHFLFLFVRKKVQLHCFDIAHNDQTDCNATCQIQDYHIHTSARNFEEFWHDCSHLTSRVSHFTVSAGWGPFLEVLPSMLVSLLFHILFWWGVQQTVGTPGFSKWWFVGSLQCQSGLCGRKMFRWPSLATVHVCVQFGGPCHCWSPFVSFTVGICGSSLSGGGFLSWPIPLNFEEAPVEFSGWIGHFCALFPWINCMLHPLHRVHCVFLCVLFCFNLVNVVNVGTPNKEDHFLRDWVLEFCPASTAAQ